eukprot:Awhi_evm1s3329
MTTGMSTTGECDNLLTKRTITQDMGNETSGLLGDLKSIQRHKEEDGIMKATEITSIRDSDIDKHENGNKNNNDNFPSSFSSFSSLSPSSFRLFPASSSQPLHPPSSSPLSSIILPKSKQRLGSKDPRFAPLQKGYGKLQNNGKFPASASTTLATEPIKLNKDTRSIVVGEALLSSQGTPSSVDAKDDQDSVSHTDYTRKATQINKKSSLALVSASTESSALAENEKDDGLISTDVSSFSTKTVPSSIEVTDKKFSVLQPDSEGRKALQMHKQSSLATTASTTGSTALTENEKDHGSVDKSSFPTQTVTSAVEVKDKMLTLLQPGFTREKATQMNEQLSLATTISTKSTKNEQIAVNKTSSSAETLPPSTDVQGKNVSKLRINPEEQNSNISLLLCITVNYC